MKKIIVEVQDETEAVMSETLELPHLSDLGDGVKDAVDDFVKLNGGVVMPPVSIHVMPADAAGEKSPA